MKKIFFLFTIATLVMTGCSKDDTELYVIDFEASSVLPYVATSNSALGVYDGGFLDAGSGLKMPATVTNSEWGAYWEGIAISQFNDMITEGYANQLSVYYKDATTEKGGYKGSNTFAVVCKGFTDPPAVSFNDDVTERTFDHFWVTNSTYAALSMKNGDGMAKKFESGDWYKLTIKALNKAGNTTGIPIEFYLADFRTAASPGIITQWTKVDLRPLGNNVHTIEFYFDSSDTNEYGMLTPGYFCFDNLAVINE